MSYSSYKCKQINILDIRVWLIFKQKKKKTIIDKVTYLEKTKKKTPL